MSSQSGKNTDLIEAVPVRSPVTNFMISAATFVIIIAGLRAAEGMVVPFLLAVFISVICSELKYILTENFF